jgi:hypothetical protein
MKLLILLSLISGLVSCVQLQENAAEEYIADTQEQSSSNKSKLDTFNNREIDSSGEAVRCSSYPYFSNDLVTWNGQTDGVEIGQDGEVIGDSTTVGTIVIQSGGKFSDGWRDRIIGEVYAFSGAQVFAPKHADIYAESGSTIDLLNSRDVIIYAEPGVQILNQDFCRSCSIYYENDVDVEAGCE